MSDAFPQLRDGLTRLLSGAADPPGAPPLGQLAAAAPAYATQALRYVSTAELDQPEAAASLREAGLAPGFLAPGFLALVRGGAEAVAAHAAARPDAEAWYADPLISAQVKDTLTALAAGRKLSLSPFTGEWVWLSHGLGAGLFPLAAPDGRRHCLVMQWCETFLPKQDTAWLFPEHGFVLVGHDVGFPPEAWPVLMQDTLHLLLSVADLAPAHLARPATGRMIVAEPAVPHIGHYIWNAASGWDGIFRWADASRLAAVASLAEARGMGGVAGLYPDRLAPGTQIIAYETEAALARVAIEQGAMLLGCRDAWIAADYAARFLRWAEAAVSAEFRARRAALREASQPLMLVTLRLDNRDWVEQGEGIVALVRALREEHPRLGVVLDGMNSDFVSRWTPGQVTLAEECAFAARIMDGIGRDERAFDSTGCPVAESLALAAVCDFYVAPIGAGMAKYRWLANLPGVSFSNTAWLDPGQWNGRLYDHYREGARQAFYLSPEDVTDLGGDRGYGRSSFSLDWRVLHARVREFLAQGGSAAR